MKINKIFHYLYFILMMLPLIFVGSSTLIYILHSIRFELSYDIIGTLISSFSDLFNNSLFLWVKTSFVAAPFNYITNLFGFSDNIFTWLITYWLSISIIWLTFDVLMYVPNLVHSWLDRGVIR